MRKFLSLIAILFALNVNAQWNDDTSVNTLVVEDNSGAFLSAITSLGETYVLYWKVVAEPTNYELRLQVLDADGNRTLGDNGVLVSDEIPMGTYTVIMSTTIGADDNLYVGLTGTGGGDQVWVFKLNTDGDNLWTGSNSNTGFGGYSVKVLPLSDGNSIVAWLSGASYSVKIMKYDADGNQLWDDGVEIHEGSDATSPAHLYELENGNVMVVFHQITYGINSFLFAQSIGLDGNLLWASNTQIADKGTRYNRSYSSLVEGNEVFYAYTGIHDNRFDSYLQKINADGSLPWGISGVNFDDNETNYEMEIEIASNLSDDNIWAISLYTDPSQGQKGEKIQKFNKVTGDKLFGANAKFIYPLSYTPNVHASSLFIQDGLPVYLNKSGEDNGATPTELQMVFLDNEGEFLFEEETFPVATYEANKSRIALLKNVNEQNVILFIENKGNGDQIFAQNYITSVAEPLGIPVNPTATADEYNILFEWEAPAKNTLLGYNIYEANDMVNPINPELIEGLSYTLPNPNNGVYYYYFTAVYEEGESEAAGPIEVILTVGINALENMALSIYPNPVKNQLNISCQLANTSDVKVSIYAITGVQMSSERYKSVGAGFQKMTVSTSQLKNGIYFMQLEIDGAIITKKFSVAK